MRRGGFATRPAAVTALEALVGPAAETAQGMTTGEWLQRWLAPRVSLRASTSRGYAAHVRSYLVPYLGGILLAELSPGDVQAMFTAVIRGEAALEHLVSAAMLRRIHATLRAALNAAVRAGLISVNPGRWPELPRAARPRPQVWTPALTERWQNEGPLSGHHAGHRLCGLGGDSRLQLLLATGSHLVGRRARMPGCAGTSAARNPDRRPGGGPLAAVGRQLGDDLPAITSRPSSCSASSSCLRSSPTSPVTCGTQVAAAQEFLPDCVSERRIHACRRGK